MNGTRTDLAKEWTAGLKEPPEGTCHKEMIFGPITAEAFSIETEKASQLLQKPVGNYYTIELPLTKGFVGDFEETVLSLAEFLSGLLPSGPVLIAGLGNASITADALGPECVDGIFTTRHLKSSLSKLRGFENLREVSALAPGVLGQTGIETAEIISAVVKAVSPAAVVAVDALAAKSAFHIGRTLQFSDAGIYPGSGVSNHRKALTRSTLGVPVIAAGTPTVSVLNQQEMEMVVTPREIDTVIKSASRVISTAFNLALQPELSLEDLNSLLS